MPSFLVTPASPLFISTSTLAPQAKSCLIGDELPEPVSGANQHFIFGGDSARVNVRLRRDARRVRDRVSLRGARGANNSNGET